MKIVYIVLVYLSVSLYAQAQEDSCFTEMVGCLKKNRAKFSSSCDVRDTKMPEPLMVDCPSSPSDFENHCAIVGQADNKVTECEKAEEGDFSLAFEMEIGAVGSL